MLQILAFAFLVQRVAPRGCGVNVLDIPLGFHVLPGVGSLVIYSVIISQEKVFSKLTVITSGIVHPVGHHLLKNPSKQKINFERVEMAKRYLQIILHVFVVGIIVIFFVIVVFIIRIKALVAMLESKERMSASWPS